MNSHDRAAPYLFAVAEYRLPRVAALVTAPPVSSRDVFNVHARHVESGAETWALEHQLPLRPAFISLFLISFWKTPATSCE